MRQITLFLCPGQRHVEQTPLLLQLADGAAGHLVGKQILLHPHDEDHTELQSLGGVYRHQRQLLVAVVVALIKITDERHFLQVMCHQLMSLTFLFTAVVHELLHTIQQFLQVFLPADVLGLSSSEYFCFHTALFGYPSAEFCGIYLIDILHERVYQLNK